MFSVRLFKRNSSVTPMQIHMIQAKTWFICRRIMPSLRRQMPTMILMPQTTFINGAPRSYSVSAIRMSYPGSESPRTSSMESTRNLSNILSTKDRCRVSSQTYVVHSRLTIVRNVLFLRREKRAIERYVRGPTKGTKMLPKVSIAATTANIHNGQL
jgi:hypothetical protein